MNDTPARRYYRSLEGRWSGLLTIRRFPSSAGPPGWTTRLRLATLAALFRLFGPVRMHTTLFAAAPGAGHDFVHTTRVEKWGITLGLTREDITIGPDGRTLTMTGEQRFAPALCWPTPYTSDGEIDEAAQGATYRIPWFGLPLVQRTAIVEQGLRFVQETPWSRGEVLLSRAA
jgi:hypothetical protein